MRVQAALARVAIDGVFVEWWRPSRQTPSGNFSVSLHLTAAADLSRLTSQAERLAVALNAHEVTFVRESPRQICMTIRRPMPTELPPYPEAPHGFVPAPLHVVPLGVD
ncbi:MAG: hypothetical protein ACYC3W_02225, partial [Candidatus Nanopelagicales bacterium]